MQGLAFSDLQSLLKDSEDRYQNGFGVLRDSLSEISNKLDRALERSARDDVRIAHLEDRVNNLEEVIPETSAVTRAAKYVATALFAALIGAASNRLGDVFLPPKPQTNTITPQQTK